MSRDRLNGTMMAATVIGLAVLAGHVALGITVGEDYAIPSTIIGAIAAAVVLRGPARRYNRAQDSSVVPQPARGHRISRVSR